MIIKGVIFGDVVTNIKVHSPAQIKLAQEFLNIHGESHSNMVTKSVLTHSQTGLVSNKDCIFGYNIYIYINWP